MNNTTTFVRKHKKLVKELRKKTGQRAILNANIREVRSKLSELDDSLFEG